MVDINLKVQNLLKTNRYFVRINKPKKKKRYWSKIKDPDGLIRDRIKNHKMELKNFVRNNKSLIKKINLIKFKSLCDIGCGPGYLLSQFNKKKIYLLGIDNDIEALKIASRYGSVLKKNLNSSKYNIRKKFDLIVCYHVIEHLKNPKLLIKNIYNLLKKNGTLIIGTPDFDSAMARYYKNKFRMLHDKTHISLFSKESLINFLRDNDFKPIDLDYPYFDTIYFNKKNLIRILSKKGYSPPFYGNMVTITCQKK